MTTPSEAALHTAATAPLATAASAEAEKREVTSNHKSIMKIIFFSPHFYFGDLTSNTHFM